MKTQIEPSRPSELRNHAGLLVRHNVRVAALLCSVLFVLLPKDGRAQEEYIGVELPDALPSTPSEKSAPPPNVEALPAPDAVTEPTSDGEFVGVELPPETSAEAVSETTDSPAAEIVIPVVAPTPEPPATPLTPIPDETAGSARPVAGAQIEPTVPAPEENVKKKFPKISVSPQVGYLFFPKAELEFNGMKATVDPRNGLSVKLHLDFGGDGVGFELSPFFELEYGGISADSSGFANLSGVDFGDTAAGASFQGTGGEFALVYRFPVKRFFPHLGIGFHGAYLFGDQISYGTELYARFPIGFTAYAGKHVGILFEVGLMVGATGIRTPPVLPEAFDSMPEELRDGLESAETQRDYEVWYDANSTEVDQWIVDNQDELPEGYSSEQMSSDFVSEQLSRSIRFGSGFAMDIMFGLRFP